MKLLLKLLFVAFVMHSAYSQINNVDYKFEEVIPLGLKSARSNSSLNFEIKNNTSRFLDFRWVDFDGNLDLVREGQNWGHHSIGPGNAISANSSTGHFFIISDPLNGKAFGYIVFLRPGNHRLSVSENDGRLVFSH
jgi:hypothetical protein